MRLIWGSWESCMCGRGCESLAFFHPPVRVGHPPQSFRGLGPFPSIPNPSPTHNPAAHSIPHNDFAYLPLIFDNVDEPRGAIKKTFAIFTLLFRHFFQLRPFCFAMPPASWLFREEHSHRDIHKGTCTGPESRLKWCVMCNTLNRWLNEF